VTINARTVAVKPEAWRETVRERAGFLAVRDFFFSLAATSPV